MLLVLLGLWGALAPLTGPYFHFCFTPDKAWDLTSGRVWMQIMPGCAVFLGGLITMPSANRAFAALGAWLAALGGAWYAGGVPLSALWAAHADLRLGAPVGGTTRQVVEQMSLLYGLGVVTVFLAALALGRLAVVGVKDAELAEAVVAGPSDADDEPATGPRTRPIPAPRPSRARRGRAGHADRHVRDDVELDHHGPERRQGRRVAAAP